MKKLLLLTLLTLLSCTASAKDEPIYTVTLEEDSKKGLGGLFGKFIIKTKDTLVSIWVGVTTNITSNEIQNYIKKYGYNQKKMAKHFKGKIKISLIEDFNALKNDYKLFENISVTYKTKQKVYYYLVSIEKDESCLVYPNKKRENNLIEKGTYTLDGFAFDKKGIVELYLINSLEPIDFSDFKAKSIYSCIEREKGIDKVEKIQKQNINDARRLDIILK